MHNNIKQAIQIGGAIVSALWTAGSLVLDVQGIAPNLKWQYYAFGGFISYIAITAWTVWDKQKQINVIGGGVKIVPIPKTVKSYHDTQTGEAGLELTIDLEIWANKDIHSDNLVLNIIGSRLEPLTVPWWNLWEVWMVFLANYPFFKRLVGLRPVNGKYRAFIKSSEKQPFIDTISFRLPNEKLKEVGRWSKGNTFMMELVLVGGIPNNTYRQHLMWKFLEKETLKPV